MAMTTTYLTVNGKIRSEQRAGEAHSRDYVLDPLGSVIQIYQNGWPIADACYEPYGGIYTQWNMEGKTFTWLGGWGYRQTGVEWSSVYVRARHYSRGLSNWTSIDPLWPAEMPYGYVEGRVMTGVDYWGERRRKNNRRRGKPNQGINTRGQHGIWHEPSPPPKSINDRIDDALGIPFFKRLSKISDFFEAFNGCIGPLLVQSFYLQPVGINPIGNWSIEEKRRICEGCCETAFSISGGIGGAFLGFHAGTFGGAIVGGMVGLPIGGMVGLSAGMTVGGGVGGSLGGLIGGYTGAVYGSHLAQGLCPDICRKLFPCPPGSNGVDSPWGPGVNRPTTYLA